MLGDKLAGGVKARSRRNLKLSLRGCVEKLPQHRPARLNKPRVRSDEDRSVRPRLAQEAREPDPRGANRVLEAYVSIFSR